MKNDQEQDQKQDEFAEDAKAQEDKRRPSLFKRLFGRKAEAPVPESPDSEIGSPSSEIAPISEVAATSEVPATPETETTVEIASTAEALATAAIEATAKIEEAAASSAPPSTPATPEAPSAAPVEAPGTPPPVKKSWWTRLTQGLSRSSHSIGSSLVEIFTKRKLDGATLDDLEDMLIRADLGVAAALRIRDEVAKGRHDKDVDVETVKTILATEVERVLAPVAKPLDIDAAHKPFVILVVGVNGSGKTTTIGKLAAKFNRDGKKLLLVAGDTFRAAAIEQLRIWGEKLNAPVISREAGGDAAGLAFDAIKAARENGTDVLIMDTAGRLQNKTELMAELEKIIRVMKKLDPEAPHAVLLVLDATVGQNAMSQVEIFGRVAGVTGLVMTKLDGTARGGILVAVAEKYKLPIHFIGVGETADDLQPFAAGDFARAIAGIDT